MGTVTKTELNQQTARVLARVAAGEHITVTERGRAIAEIGPPRESAWDRLVAEGKVRPATATGGVTIEPIWSGVTTAEIMDDIRGERW
jgi:prevent-host-death family protein